MKKKMLISYIIILLVGTLTTGMFSYSFIRNSYLKNKEDKLISNANLIIDSLKIEQELEEGRNFFLLTQKFSDQIGARVTFIDNEGQVLADSQDNSIMFTNQNNQPEIILAKKGEVKSIQKIDEKTGKTNIYLAMPPIEINNIKLIIRLSDTIEDILQLNYIFFKYIIISILIGLTIAMFIGYWHIGSILKPIKELKKASNLISKGDFNKRIKVETNDELQELGESFNKMAIRLERMISKMEDQNIKMNSMLTGMEDGVIALDLNQKILLINEEAKKLLELDKKTVVGMNFQEATKNQTIYKIIKNTSIEKKSHKEEIKLNNEKNNIIKIKSSLMWHTQNSRDIIGVFLLIQDITERRKLENMKNEFVANVSHELRTPLTLISGFVETLQVWENLDKKDRTTALEIIKLETERLKRLINNILKLSEIENIESTINQENLYIKELIYEVSYILKPLLGEKNIFLILDIEEDLHVIWGNRDWFKQLMMNLIENAIKYTYSGDEVKVVARNNNDEVIILVKDSGIGIPEKDIERIFERFYRVDKTSSREIGGTGLGLTIVKHIVSELGGKIEVSSIVNKGSEFKIILPSKSSNKEVSTL